MIQGGRERGWNPAQYDKNARFVSDLGMPVVELRSPQLGTSGMPTADISTAQSRIPSWQSIVTF
jgi:hypothetical protein